MTAPLLPNEQDLRQKLAAIEHERWADWQKWCHKVLRENNPSPEIGDVLERWDRQIETPYAELSDAEKASDMEQVDRYWHLIALHTQQEVDKAKADHEEIIRLHRQEAHLAGRGVSLSNTHSLFDTPVIQEASF